MNEPPELKALLVGISEKEEREAVTNAYYKLSSGNPDTFPVLFALLIKASALSNEHYAETLKKVADTTTDGNIYNMLEEVQHKLGSLDEKLSELNLEEISSKFPSLKGLKEIAGELKIAVSNMPRSGSQASKTNEKKAGNGGLAFLLILNLVAVGYLIFKLTL